MEDHQTLTIHPPAVARLDCCGCDGTNGILQNKAIMRSLAITEIILGGLAMFIGSIVSAIAGSIISFITHFPQPFTTGEGLWCGVFIVAAGVTGMMASKPDSTYNMINAHMGLSITAAVLCPILFTLAVISPLIFPSDSFIVLNFLNAILALACLGILIRSAHLCCLCIPGCCCTPASQVTTQVITSNQQLGERQGSPYVQGIQGYSTSMHDRARASPQQPVGAF